MRKNLRFKRINLEPGDTVWIMPIRYWEPKEYEPIQFDIINTNDSDNYYGFHHGYDHETYVSAGPFTWFSSYEDCRIAQFALTTLYELCSKSDVTLIVKRTLEVY